MTNIYAHISNGDVPKSQHVTEVSFVDENGKHVDIGGGGTTTALSSVATLDSSAALADVINKVNEILNAVKNAR